jgi:phosphoribosylformylglycinamidine cyclo-ligase
MVKKPYLIYQQMGTNYNTVDSLKRMAQVEGKKTIHNLIGSKMKELEESRGESAYVLESEDAYLAFVEEGLGTKNLVADAMYQITKNTYYDSLAQDTVAMIVNDIITVGAKPTLVLAYWAAGSGQWFENQQRAEDLVKGWADACNLAGASWGGGETPALPGVIKKKAIDLAGACFGVIQPKTRLIIGDMLEAGDRIILLESSGIHANGLSLARKIATTLPKGYATRISNGRMYGEALLTPTVIYAKLIQDLLAKGLEIHYMVNITGHGWRKLMRYATPFTYRITAIPVVPPILEFMIAKGPIKRKEAYGNLNKGAGFAIIAPSKDVGNILLIAQNHKITAYNAGRVEHGKKQVIIEPENIVFEEESLKIRG